MSYYYYAYSLQVDEITFVKDCVLITFSFYYLPFYHCNKSSQNAAVGLLNSSFGPRCNLSLKLLDLFCGCQKNVALHSW